MTVHLRIGKMTCIEFCGMMGYKDMLRELIESSVNVNTLKKYFSLNGRLNICILALLLN